MDISFYFERFFLSMNSQVSDEIRWFFELLVAKVARVPSYASDASLFYGQISPAKKKRLFENYEEKMFIDKTVDLVRAYLKEPS